MGLEDLRRWQWAGIGLVVGLAFGGVQVFHGSDPDTSDFVRRLNSQREFEVGLTREPQTDWKITDLVVHPSKNGRVWLTFTQLRPLNKRMDPNDPNSPRAAHPDQVHFDVAEPYKPMAVQPKEAKSDLTVREYLADLQKNFPDAQIKYRYAWWEIPRNTLALSGAAGLVLIGGIWPSIVGLITGAGIWGPGRRKDDAYDLSRYGKGQPAATAAAAGVSAEDQSKLEEMEEAMLANLGGFGANGRTRDSDSIDEDAPIRPLTGGPLEGDATTAAEREAGKEYKGDFYPVARPAGKKDEE